ncbi:MAG: ribosome recycling factor [Candidatus Eiseniibacteriota bacterium]|nr:MAG: ribosome recycling factor [Candidatus Eisenbacteria bacterium]
MEKEILRNTEQKMKKGVEHLRQELASVRTGKATTALLDPVRVEYYGSQVPLNQIAGVSAPEARLLVVHPWERAMVPEVEKAILKADLGLNPTSDGTIIRIPIPSLTEERRKDLVKVVRKMVEEGRVTIRNLRREGNDEIKSAEKKGSISEDVSRKTQNEIQNLTDKHIEMMDELLTKKEAEIMEV